MASMFAAPRDHRVTVKLGKLPAVHRHRASRHCHEKGKTAFAGAYTAVTMALFAGEGPRPRAIWEMSAKWLAALGGAFYGFQASCGQLCVWTQSRYDRPKALSGDRANEARTNDSSHEAVAGAEVEQVVFVAGVEVNAGGSVGGVVGGEGAEGGDRVHAVKVIEVDVEAKRCIPRPADAGLAGASDAHAEG